MSATRAEVTGDPGGDVYSPSPPGSMARIAATVVALSSVLFGKLLIGIGLRSAPEGWRRTVGILLRGESTRFALSAFGLSVPAVGEGMDRQPRTLETRTAEALLNFLSREPDAHFRLEWRSRVTLRVRTAFVDLVMLRFAEDETLQGIVPHLAAGGPPAPPPEVQARVHAAVITAYNRTAGLPEVARPAMLMHHAQSTLAGDSNEALRFVDRLLAACCLSFEGLPHEEPSRRFCPPAFSKRRGLGLGYLSWIARPDDTRGSVDLWVSAHHVGLDGVPLQDLLNRLERAWGCAEVLEFPAPTGATAFAGPSRCHAPGERAVDQLITFVDLTPVVMLRRQLSARYAAEIGGEVTLGALLAWLLSQEPEFRGVRIASTVDVAASSGYERDVDVVSLRPADYVKTEGPWSGFVEYAREFNRLVAAARTRTSPVRAGMQTAGLIPAWAHAAAVRANPASLDDAFGSLCVTIVRDARVFIAPMTDLGLGHGFFAIGNVNLPSASGARVTAVSIKGDAGRVEHYPAILQRIIERSARLSANSIG